jgi:hypothetical protein
MTGQAKPVTPIVEKKSRAEKKKGGKIVLTELQSTPPIKETWKKSQREGIFALLNLRTGELFKSRKNSKFVYNLVGGGLV